MRKSRIARWRHAALHTPRNATRNVDPLLLERPLLAEAVINADSAVSLLESVSSRLLATDSGPRAAALRTQAAFVRALLDEVQRRLPRDVCLEALSEQLDEEVTRLARLLGDVREYPS